jgi:uncharacterized membrane protein
MVLDAVLKGVDYQITGQPPYFPFAGGSFANGGAMRISPLAISFRNASSDVLRAACEEAIKSRLFLLVCVLCVVVVVVVGGFLGLNLHTLSHNNNTEQ